MTKRQPIVAAALAVAVTWAGALCACALPSTDVSEATGHHAHHDMAGSPQADCAHAGCAGDCGIEATGPQVQASVPELPKTSLDDPFALATATARVALGARVPIHHHPPWRTPRPADSPVHRFDRLLN